MLLAALLVRHDAASAAFVRRQLACDLAHYRLPAQTIDDAVLVASELVGNAVRHTSAAQSGTLDVRWNVDASGVRVSVGDPSAEPPHQRVAAEHDTEGRGLQLVDAMSDDWGVDLDAHGKTVWAHVPIVRADAAKP